HIVSEIADEQIDYLIFDSMYPIGQIVGQILRVPTVASHAVFAKPEEMISEKNNPLQMENLKDHPTFSKYKAMVKRMSEAYKIKIPDLMKMTPNYGDLNFAYTSSYFVKHTEYDESFRFIGGPVNILKERIDFPFERLKDKKVVFISLGTAFNKVNL